MPGLGLIFAGLLGYSFAMPGMTFAGVTLDAHTLLFSSLFLLLGYQSILFSLFAKTFAITEGLLPEDPFVTRLFRTLNLEKTLLLGAGALLLGLALLVVAMNEWRMAGFGRLDYAHTMRLVIPGATLTALGFQTILSGFFVSVLGLRRR
jgi:hypothetical protein